MEGEQENRYKQATKQTHIKRGIGKGEKNVLSFKDITDKVNKTLKESLRRDCLSILKKLEQKKKEQNDDITEREVNFVIEAMQKIGEKTEEAATTLAIDVFKSLVLHKDLKIEETEHYWNQIFQAIINNTQWWQRKNIFSAIGSILKNAQLSFQWLTTGFTNKLIEIVKRIDEKTKTASEKKSAFYALNSIISNSHFNHQHLSIIETILQNTEGEATQRALEAFDSFISHKDFKIEWIEKYWDPIFDAIINNTKGEATEEAFESFNNKIQKSTSKAEILLFSLILRTRINKGLKDQELVKAIKNIEISKYSILLQEISLLSDNEIEALLNAVNSCDVKALRGAFVG